MTGRNLRRVSALFVLATLTACSGGDNGGGGAGPNPDPNPPAPVPGEPGPTPSPGPQASAISLPKTGQTVCYDPNGSADEVTCPDTGQDGEYQVGVAEPSPRYTTDSTGECITDNLTGLMWTRNSNLLGGSTGTTWQEAITASNELELCGFNDWRLPNRNELRSHINHQESDNRFKLEAAGFQNAFVGPTSYWSSTSYTFQGAPTHAWSVVMAQGQVTANVKTRGSNVWPVRTSDQGSSAEIHQTGQTVCSNTAGATIDCASSGQDGEYKAGVAWPEPRFTVGTGETADCVVDNLTGLMWMRALDSIPGEDFAGAISLSNDLTLCGFSDWRLSNVREIESLINNGVDNNAAYLNSQGFSGVQQAYYWTSTSDALRAQQNTRPAWVIDIGSGLLHTTYKQSPGAYYSWPVRGGQ